MVRLSPKAVGRAEKRSLVGGIAAVEISTMGADLIVFEKIQHINKAIKRRYMDYITEDKPVVKNVIPTGSLKIVGDSIDFGMAPVPRKESTVESKPEVAKKDWGIR